MGQLVEFAGNHPVLVLFIMAMAAAVIVYELRLKALGVTNVSPPQAVRLINKGAVVVDVRDRDQFVTGHLVNAKNFPLGDIESDRKRIDKYRNKTVLAVCDTGATSGKAANVLRGQGFENVFSLRGGLRAWQEENLPLVK